MVFPLNIALNGTEEAATATSMPNLRLFGVGTQWSTVPFFSPNSRIYFWWVAAAKSGVHGAGGAPA